MVEVIKGFELKKLSIAEHFEFHLQTRGFIESATPECISSQEQFEAYQQLIDEEVGIIKRKKASYLTPQIVEKDRERDQLISYIFTTIRNGKNAPIESLQESYKALIPIVSAYKGLSYKSKNEETALIETLLRNLQAEKVARHIDNLGISETLATLSRVNDEYMMLCCERTSQTPKRVDTNELRSKVDLLYNTIVQRANATLVLASNESAIKLKNNLNNLIDQTKAAYNRRDKRVKRVNGEGGK